jgi:hypothetical protein
MIVYEVYDSKGEYLASFVTEGHALSYSHVLGLGKQNISISNIVNKANIKEGINNLNNG